VPFALAGQDCGQWPELKAVYQRVRFAR